MSCRFSADLSSLRASVADSWSYRAGARSIGSSVMLKSPTMRSIVPACVLDHSELIFSQKFRCSFALFGA